MKAGSERELAWVRGIALAGVAPVVVGFIVICLAMILWGGSLGGFVLFVSGFVGTIWSAFVALEIALPPPRRFRS